MPDRTVSVRLHAHVDQYKRAMADATSATREFARMSDKELQQLGQRMQRFGTGMTVALTAPLALLGREAVKLATDANEAMNRVDVVFGRSATAIETWAEDAVDNLGLARHEAASAASTFGTIFDSLGIGAEQAAGMSMSMVQLASDFASFHNADITDVVQAQTAVFRGEYDAVQRFLPALTQATIDQRALADSGKATTNELTAQDKALASFALMLEGAGAAQGDFARTADDAANAQRRAGAAYREAMTELGDNLLPIVAKGALGIADIAEAFADLPEGAQTAILGFAGLAAAAGPLIVVLGSVVRNLETISKVGGKAGGALRWGGVAAGLVGVGLVLNEIRQNAQDVTVDLEKMAGAADAALVQAFRDADKSEGLWGRFKDAVNPVDFAKDLLEGNPAGVDQHDNQQLELFTELAEGAFGAAERLRDALAAEGEDVTELDRILADVSARHQQAEIDAGALGTTVETTTGKIDDYGAALDALYGSTFAVEDATDALRGDLIDFANAVAQAKADGDAWATSLAEGTARGLENREALRGLASGALDVAAAMREQGAEETAIASVMGAYRQQLVDTMTQLGFNRTEVERYLDVLLQIPGTVGTDIRLNVDPAMAALDAYIAKLSSIPSLLQSTISAEEEHDAVRFRNLRSITSTPPTGLLTPGLADAVAGKNVTTPDGKSPADLANEWEAEIDRQMGAKHQYGAITVDSYKQYLDARIAATEEFTGEWERLMGDMESVNKQIGDAWRAAAEGQRQIEDAMFETGAMSKDRYLELLNERLAGLEEFSSEWLAVWRQIQQVTDEQRGKVLDIIAAVDEQRRFDQEFYAVAGQRMLSELRLTAADSASIDYNALAAAMASARPNMSLSMSATVAGTGDTRGDLTTANEKMRDQAFLMGL